MIKVTIKKLIIILLVIYLSISGYFIFEHYRNLSLKEKQEEAELQIKKNDPDNYGWIKKSSEKIFEKRDSHSLYEFDGKLFILGGLDGDDSIIGEHAVDYSKSKYYKDVWQSNDGINWNKSTSDGGFPLIRSASVFEKNNKVYLVAGWSPTAGYDIGVWESSDGINFEKIKDSPEFGKREGQKVLDVDGKLYLFGGVNYEEHKTFNDVWVSEDGINWQLLSANNPWHGRWDHDVVYFEDYFYLVGGMHIGGVGFSDVWKSKDGKFWEKILDNAPWGERQGQNVLAWRGYMWLFAGLQMADDSGFGDTWVSKDGVTWKKTLMDGAFVGREDQTGVIFKDKIIFMGGMDMNWHWNNDVWQLEYIPCLNNLDKERIRNLNINASWSLSCVDNDGRMFPVASNNLTKKVGIASVTKLMTSMLFYDNFDTKDRLVVTKDSIGFGSANRYYEDESFTKGFALNSLLIESDNDIARSMANYFGMNSFLSMMNRKAKLLGLNDTSFRDPAGLDINMYNASNLSTPFDISKLVLYVFKNYPDLVSITKKKSEDIKNDAGYHHTAIATNKLLDDTDVGDLILMAKTGETLVAKKNLATVFKDRKNHIFVSVVLGSEDNFADTKKIIQSVLN